MVKKKLASFSLSALLAGGLSDGEPDGGGGPPGGGGGPPVGGGPPDGGGGPPVGGGGPPEGGGGADTVDVVCNTGRSSSKSSSSKAQHKS